MLHVKYLSSIVCVYPVCVICSDCIGTCVVFCYTVFALCSECRGAFCDVFSRITIFTCGDDAVLIMCYRFNEMPNKDEFAKLVKDCVIRAKLDARNYISVLVGCVGVYEMCMYVWRVYMVCLLGVGGVWACTRFV